MVLVVEVSGLGFVEIQLGLRYGMLLLVYL